MISEVARRRRKLNAKTAKKKPAPIRASTPIPTVAQMERKKRVLSDLERELGFYPSDLKPLTFFALKDFLENLKKSKSNKRVMMRVLQ